MHFEYTLPVQVRRSSPTPFNHCHNGAVIFNHLRTVWMPLARRGSKRQQNILGKIKLILWISCRINCIISIISMRVFNQSTPENIVNMILTASYDLYVTIIRMVLGIGTRAIISTAVCKSRHRRRTDLLTAKVEITFPSTNYHSYFLAFLKCGGRHGSKKPTLSGDWTHNTMVPAFGTAFGIHQQRMLSAKLSKATRA